MATTGLRISFSLSDAKDRVEVLKNLGLNYFDLQRIRYIRDGDPDAGAAGLELLTQEDLITISGLDQNVEKKVNTIYKDVDGYIDISDAAFSALTTPLNFQLDLKGRYISPAYKFYKLDWDSETVSIVDFSTSRRSAWSNFGAAEDQVVYGNEVLLSGGTSIDLDSINILADVTETRFEAEVPTDLIDININGQDYQFFAMRGIPFVFNGFFRNAEVAFTYNVLPGQQRPTIVVKDTLTEIETIYTFENSNETISELLPSINQAFSANRDIEFYYPASNVLVLDVTDLAVINFPQSVFTNLQDLKMNNNNIVTFPDFRTYTPVATVLDLKNSFQFANSPTTALRTLSNDVLDRIPASVQELYLSITFGGTITADFSRTVGGSQEFASLRILHLEGNVGRKFTSLPAGLPSSLNELVVSNNDISTITLTNAETPALAILRTGNNTITNDDGGYNITTLSPSLVILEHSGTDNDHGIIDVTGFAALETYSVTDINYFTDNFGVSDNIGTNIFTGCTSLEVIEMDSSTVSGTFPDFSANTSLRVISFNETDWQNFTVTHSLDNDTFGPSDGGCRPTLEEFILRSNITIPEEQGMNLPIENLTFRDMTELSNCQIFNMPLGGTVPESLFDDCTKLQQLEMYNLGLTGTLPDPVLLTQLQRLKFDENALSGTIPNIELDNLTLLNLSNNQFTSTTGFNCPNLLDLYLQNNNLTIWPSISSCTRVQNLNLSNNAISTYSSGTFAVMNSIFNLDLNSMGLNVTSVDQILLDLNTSYNTTFRTNVTVNLLGNAAPSPTDLNNNILNRLRGANWQIDVEI